MERENERVVKNREDFGRIRNKREYLVLEAHLDDFEIAMSTWLQKQANVPTKITLVTWCSAGRDFENGVSRKNKRQKNLDYFKSIYPNIEIENLHLQFIDLELEKATKSQLIQALYARIKDFDIEKYKEIYFHQADLHPDHTAINVVGKILTRNFKGKVFEFIIKNSIYCSDSYNYNTEIKAEYKYSDDRYSEKFIYPCLYPSEKTKLQHILYNQKNYDGKYVSDRFNLIRDIFVSQDV